MSLNTDLISYWKLDESSGNRADSFASNTLTDNNTVGSATGKINLGADFERSASEYLSITDGSQAGLDLGAGGADFSLSLWVKIESNPTQWFMTGADDRALISKYTSVSNQRSFFLEYGYDGTNYVFASHVTNDGTTLVSNKVVCGNLTTGSFYHVAVTYDASASLFTWYLNGSLVGTTAGVSSIFNSTAPFQLGALSQQGAYMDGILDEVGIWSRVLSADDITTLYNSGSGLAYPFPTTTFQISGTVTLSGAPVEGAVVRCIRQSDNVAITEQTTSSTGAYLFTELAEAELYHLCVEHTDGATTYNAKSLWDIVPIGVEL